MTTQKTRKDIRRAILDRLYPRDPFRYADVDEANYTGTTITITELTSSMLHPQRIVSNWVRVQHVNGSDVSVEEEARCTQYNHATGTITLSPTLTAPDGTGTAAVEFHYEMHPDIVDKAINRIMRSLYRPAYAVLTEVPDGNMEDVGTGSWGPVGVGTTELSKRTFITSGEDVPMGDQVLHFKATAASGVISEDIPVYAGKAYFISVPFGVAATAQPGSATLSVVNSVSNAVVWSETVSIPFNNSVTGWYEVRDTMTIPSGCDAVKFRIVTVGGGTLEYHVDSVSLLQIGDEKVKMPAAVEIAEDITDVFTLPVGTNIAGDLYDWNTKSYQQWEGYPHPEHHLGRGFVELPQGVGWNPVVVRYLDRFAEFTDDITNSYVDMDVVVNGAMYYLSEVRGDAAGMLVYGKAFDKLARSRMGIPDFDVAVTPMRRQLVYGD